jgi:hypothetical protein
MRPSRRSVFRIAAALAIGVSLAGCTTPAPSAAPPASARSAAEVYGAIRSDVQGIRGLAPTAAVEPVAIDESQLRRNLEAEFDTANTPAELKFSEDLLIALGLLPTGSSVRELTLDFQSGQVAGYYSPERNELFVVSRSGGLGAAEKVTYAHEFTHQLQDQHGDLERLEMDANDQSDRSLARLALVEGDAVSVQAAWMQSALSSKELGELLAVALGPSSMEALQRAPAYLRETALFPYNEGFAFASRLLATGGYETLNAAYEDPPDSTEQVLHPDAYLEREEPVAVSIPNDLAASLGPGWTEAGRDTLGELILRVWLREGGLTAAEARTGAAGWGGDRLVLLRGPGGEVSVGLRTAWDSPADATEFASAAERAIDGHDLDGVVIPGAGPTAVIVAIGLRAADVAAALTGGGG